MITLEHSIKAKGINVVISGFLRRGDSLESKRAETKAIVGDMCKEEDVKYMEHENMNIEHHNGSLLHLNKYGDSVFANNFLILLKERLISGTKVDAEVSSHINNYLSDLNVYHLHNSQRGLAS